MAKDTLTVTDNRTGKSYELAIKDGTIRALDLREIKTGADDFGLLSYDPAYLNTASCRSSITFIDGDKGILRYRGYDVAESGGEVDVSRGRVPRALRRAADQGSAGEAFTSEITVHTFLHENARRFIDGFRYDAHPMGMLIATVARAIDVLSRSQGVRDERQRRQQIVRLMAKMPTIAAWSYRHSLGFPLVYPDNTLSYPGEPLVDDEADGRAALSSPIRSSSARSTCSSSCTPITSRTARPRRCAPSARRWWTPTRRSRRRRRRSTGRCTAAPTRPSCACCSRSATSRTCRRSSSR